MKKEGVLNLKFDLSDLTGCIEIEIDKNYIHPILEKNELPIAEETQSPPSTMKQFSDEDILLWSSPGLIEEEKET